MTKHFAKNRRPTSLVRSEHWQPKMLTQMNGFPLRYLLPRRWWPKGPESV